MADLLASREGALAEGTLVVGELDQGDRRVGVSEEGRVGDRDVGRLERLLLPVAAGGALEDRLDLRQLPLNRRLALLEGLDLPLERANVLAGLRGGRHIAGDEQQ